MENEPLGDELRWGKVWVKITSDSPSYFGPKKNVTRPYVFHFPGKKPVKSYQ